jgi:glycine C-acetyltransferase
MEKAILKNSFKEKIVQYALQDYYHLKKGWNHSNLSFSDRFSKAHDIIQNLKAQDSYLYRRNISSTPSFENNTQNQWSETIRMPINLGSNDYLNFIRHSEVIAAGRNALNKFGAGAGSVPMFSGTHLPHQVLEKKLAAFFGYESCILYNSGYAANVGCLGAIAGENDAVIMDTLVHASIIDGATSAYSSFFIHNDIDALKRSIVKTDNFRNKIIILEGVYSMDGDLGIIPEAIEIAKSEKAILMIDDSHGIGVMGKNGKGTTHYFHRSGEVDILTGSLGKAFAGIGGFVCGSKELISYLEIMSRPFIYSSSIPPAVVACILKEIELLETGDKSLSRLWENTHTLTKGLKNIGLDLGKTVSPIIPIIIKDEIKVLKICSFLETKGIFVNPVIYPVVSKNKSRLRISVTAALSQEEISYALRSFHEAYQIFLNA